jgi:predicted component of type VI protein secretion system
MIDAYAQALREAIVRHEPRLREVRVEAERATDALSPWRLVVSAVFPNEDQPRNVCVAAPF